MTMTKEKETKTKVDPFTRMLFELLFFPVNYYLKNKKKECIKVRVTNKRSMGNETILKI